MDSPLARFNGHTFTDCRLLLLTPRNILLSIYGWSCYFFSTVHTFGYCINRSYEPN